MLSCSICVSCTRLLSREGGRQGGGEECREGEREGKHEKTEEGHGSKKKSSLRGTKAKRLASHGHELMHCHELKARRRAV
jgi:hypothetical protein